MSLTDAMDEMSKKQCRIFVDLFGVFYSDIVRVVSSGGSWAKFAQTVAKTFGGREVVIVVDGRPTVQKERIHEERAKKRVIARRKIADILRERKPRRSSYKAIEKQRFGAVAITLDHKRDIVRALQKEGLFVASAPGEADVMIAQLVQASGGTKCAVVSPDGDMLVHGAQYVLKQARRKDTVSPLCHMLKQSNASVARRSRFSLFASCPDRTTVTMCTGTGLLQMRSW